MTWNEQADYLHGKDNLRKSCTVIQGRQKYGCFRGVKITLSQSNHNHCMAAPPNSNISTIQMVIISGKYKNSNEMHVCGNSYNMTRG